MNSLYENETNNSSSYNDPIFKNLDLEIPGTIIMFIMIALSNAGGLSGAGSNIPVILIFYKLTMD